MKQLLFILLPLSLSAMDRDGSQHHSIKRDQDPRTPVESYNLSYSEKTEQDKQREQNRERRNKITSTILLNKIKDKVGYN